MRYFSALCARMYRLSANSRATISSTAIFLSQQSRQYFSSPRGSDTSLAPHNAHRALTTDLRGIAEFKHYRLQTSDLRLARLSRAGAYMRPVYSLTMRRAENCGATVR